MIGWAKTLLKLTPIIGISQPALKDFYTAAGIVQRASQVSRPLGYFHTIWFLSVTVHGTVPETLSHRCHNSGLGPYLDT